MDSKITTAQSLRAALAKLDADIKEAVKSGEVKKTMRKLNVVLREVLRVKKAKTHPEIFKEFGHFLWSVVVDYKRCSNASDFDVASFAAKHRDALAKIEGTGPQLTSTTESGLVNPTQVPDMSQSATARIPHVSQSATPCLSDALQLATPRVSDASQSPTPRVSDASQSAAPCVSDALKSATPRVPNASKLAIFRVPDASKSAIPQAAANDIPNVLQSAPNRGNRKTPATQLSAESGGFKLTPSEATILALSNVIMKPNHASRAVAELATSSSTHHVPPPANNPAQKSKTQIQRGKRGSKSGESSRGSLPTKSVGLFAHEVAMAHFDRPDSPENKFRALKLQKMLKKAPPQEPKSGSEYEEVSESEESAVETGSKRKRSVKAPTPTTTTPTPTTTTTTATKCDRCLKNNKECQEILSDSGKRAYAFCSKHKKGCTWGGILVSENRRANKASAAKTSKRGPKGKKSESTPPSNDEAMPPKKRVKSQQFVIDTDEASEGEQAATRPTQRSMQKQKSKPSESVDFVKISSGSDTPAPSKPAPTSAFSAPSAAAQNPASLPSRCLQDSDIIDIPTISDFARRINELEIMGCATQVDLAILRTTNEDLQEELSNLKAEYNSLKRGYDNLYERVSRHRNAAVDRHSAFSSKWEAGMQKVKAEVKYLSDSLERTDTTLLSLEGRVDEIQMMHQMTSDGAYLSEELGEDLESASEDGLEDGSVAMDLSSDDKASTSSPATNLNADSDVNDNPASASTSDFDADPASDNADPASDHTDPASADNADPASDGTANAVTGKKADHNATDTNISAADHGVKAIGSENIEGSGPIGDVTPPQPPTTPPALPLSPPPPALYR
ncbi:hypothetical protein JR316_0002977 [Psilocybe cubensis]|uniref:Uncharacterized protein n=2 Tax=Psilocybe cubensis TaxID=181762 RepID=A0A8H7Y1J0_PSICU|nr:hypothetical protein JR316_0002977 [Psilocybe cubensis]KAH9483509.1 hypothetical protein JR316_0002977 [Psilocybe cubensis]